MIDLKNLNIILTGSTGGIGGAILEKLYSLNATIIATGTNQVKLDKMLSIILVKMKRIIIIYIGYLMNALKQCYF